MPRIGLGQIDWDFQSGGPVYFSKTPEGFPIDYFLVFHIELDDWDGVIEFRQFVCQNGDFTNVGTPFEASEGFFASSLQEVRSLKSLAFAIQKLSTDHFKGVKLERDDARGPGHFRLTLVTTWSSAQEILWPSRFLESIARKLRASMREYKAE
jgi:hypothetical protein